MKKYKFRLLTLLAFYQTEGDGDEIFLRIGKERVWPIAGRYKKMAEPMVNLGLTFDSITLGETIELELWEYDHIFSSNCLGKFKLMIDSKGGPYTTDMVRHSNEYANYSIVWEIN